MMSVNGISSRVSYLDHRPPSLAEKSRCIARWASLQKSPAQFAAKAMSVVQEHWRYLPDQQPY